MSLEDRRRPMEPNHVRTMEVQSLDALLRIEETLTSILEGMRHLAKQLKTEAPAEEPYDDAEGRSIANKVKGKRK
ncbi:hypothetical protein [Bradyrhizobium lupini]|uniref:hypothetical protein n=1 Tax=Rhizobium lupini TaxID=136996 RepID=UPI0034C5DE0C